MSTCRLTTPVLFIIFSRPDTTQKVFDAIREAKPAKLFVAADGPRENNDRDRQRCKETRDIIKQVDWDCEVKTLFHQKNLGCKLAPFTAINWFFENVEEGIILEDDCLPDPSFFLFCQELLYKYKNDETVMHIAGTNVLPCPNIKESFIFSRLVPTWGWATWRRAWKLYDIEMKNWYKYKNSKDIKWFGRQAKNFSSFIENIMLEDIDAWDGQWAFTCLYYKGLGIIPKHNLIGNIGFRLDATHTLTENERITKVPVVGVEFPIILPNKKEPNSKFDEEYLQVHFGKVTVLKKVKKLIKNIINYFFNKKLRPYR